MNKNKKIRAWIMLLIWMTVIFLMSNQPGEVSSSQSELVLKFFSLLGIELNQYFGELATFIVRKIAHFSEYLILFLLSYKVSKYYFTSKKARICSLIFVFLYASTDEFHQYFIPGRTSAFRDVLIDTCGGLFAYLIMKIRELVKIKKVK